MSTPGVIIRLNPPCCWFNTRKIRELEEKMEAVEAKMEALEAKMEALVAKPEAAEEELLVLLDENGMIFSGYTGGAFGHLSLLEQHRMQQRGSEY